MLTRICHLLHPHYKKIATFRCFNGFSKLKADTKISIKTNPTQEGSNYNRIGNLQNLVFGLVLGGIGYRTLLNHGDCEEKKLPDGSKNKKFEKAIEKCRDIVQQVKDEFGSPGVVIGVSVDGQEVWSEGFGYADVENRVPCTSDTVMRIASISKPITMTIVARLMEEGKLDIDKAVQAYVPSFPQKTFDGKQVTITTRQLLCHMSGIRGYNKDYMEKTKKNDPKAKESDVSDKKKRTDKEIKSEFYIKEHFDSISDSLKLFQDDPLVTEPGTKFLYSTHGWTLVSAVLEGATKQSFSKLMRDLLKDLGMEHTSMEEHEPLIYNRSRYYFENDRGKLVNAPYVDLSYKWAGGGLISTVGDIVKFGNIILYSYQASRETQAATDGTKQGHMKRAPKETNGSSEHKHLDKKSANEMSPTSVSDKAAKEHLNKKLKLSKKKLLPGYLKSETVKTIWEPVKSTGPDGDPDGCFALGWAVVTEKREKEFCEHRRFYTAHTGGSMGATSVFLILPSETEELCSKGRPPIKGVVVVMLANINRAHLNAAALKIAKIFDTVDR